MARELVAHNKPVFEHLHRRVYAAAIGLVVWYAVAAWLLFDRKDDIGLPLAMVSVLLLVAVPPVSVTPSSVSVTSSPPGG